MTSFEDRLRKAVDRGEARHQIRANEEAKKTLSAEQLKSLHTSLRLSLSERIESCVKRLPNHFPGFEYSTIFGEKGWGAGCQRDDIGPGPDGKRANYFSRFEMTIRPFSPALKVVELACKGTIRNKELLNQNHYELIEDADEQTFGELIDVWVLDYAELFAANR